MYYHNNLREQLQARQERLHRTIEKTSQNDLRAFIKFIEGMPYLKSLIIQLDALAPDVTADSWTNEHWEGEFGGFPEDEAAAKVCYQLIKQCAEQEDLASNLGFFFSDGALVDVQANLQFFMEVVVDRFVDYVLDQLESNNNVLYLLEKYKRRIEWFHRAELLTALRSDTRQSESVVDASLREYLFDQGIDYPFSTPLSSSGRSDIVANLGEEQPLVMEVKLFDLDRGYDRSYIRQGFRQIYDYTADYGQSVGYLVIFNCTPKTLQFQLESGTKTWPPRIEIDHRTFFLIVIDLVVPEESASKRGALDPYIINEVFLTSKPE